MSWKRIPVKCLCYHDAKKNKEGNHSLSEELLGRIHLECICNESLLAYNNAMIYL